MIPYIIHYCAWSQMKDIERYCDKEMAWAWPKDKLLPLPENVYEVDDGWLYTFEKELFNCPSCKELYGSRDKSSKGVK